MRVSYVTMQFPAPSETFACTEVRALRKQRVNVSVYELRSSHKRKSEMLAQRGCQDVPVFQAGLFHGMRVMLFHPIVSLHLIGKVFFSCRAQPFLLLKSLLLLPRSFHIWDIFCKDPPDIVHLFWGHYPSLVGWLVKYSGLSCRLTIFLGAYDLVMRHPISRVLLPMADVVFSHAHVNVPAIRSMAEVPVVVVHRGIEVERLRSATEAERIPGRLLVAGRLIKAKRIDLVIELAAALAPSNPGVSLVVAGDGSERPILERMAREKGISERIDFIGHVDQSRLFTEMQKAEVFVLMSEHDGERLPNVLKEAMFFGCVCFTSPSPGISELVEHGVDGFVFGTDRLLEALEESVAKVLADADWRAEIGCRAKQVVQDRFDVEKLVEQYIGEWKGGLHG